MDGKEFFPDLETRKFSLLKILLVRIFGKYICQIHDGKAYKYRGVIYII